MAEWRSDARAHGDIEMSMKTFPPISSPSTPVDADVRAVVDARTHDDPRIDSRAHRDDAGAN
jgi:hypothetical protein